MVFTRMLSSGQSLMGRGDAPRRLARLLVCMTVCASLCWAIVWQSWATVTGVACLSIFGTAVALKRWKTCLAMFTLAVVVLTWLTISIWSVDGMFFVHASLGRYAAIGAAGAWGLTMMAWGRVEGLQGFEVGWLAIVFLVSVSWIYSI